MKYKTELMHYGVLGMHWGIRRYQPYETTGPRKGGKRGKEIGEAARSKSRPDGKADTKKKRRKWKELSQEERDSIKRRVILASAGVAVAAIAGTAAYKIGRDQIGYTVRNQSLERVTQNAAGDIHHRIFTSTKKDRGQYSGMLANQLDNGMYGATEGAGAYRHKLNVDKVKVAGDIPAKKVFNELYKSDPTFKLHADAQMQNYRNAAALIDGFKPPKNTYDAFNYSLKQFGGMHDVQQKKFYDALTAKGFDAVNDRNDRSYFLKGSRSGYDSADANILFNTSKVKSVNSIKLTKEQMNELEKKWKQNKILKQTIKSSALSASPLIALGGVAAATKVGKAAADEYNYQKKKKALKKKGGSSK